VYLEEVRNCDVYVCLLGNEYGVQDAQGISSTEREFREATKQGKTRLLFIKAGIPEPQFEQRGGQFVLTIRRKKATRQRAQAQVEAQEAPVIAQVTAQVIAQVIAFCHEPRTAKEIMAELGLRHWKTFQANYLRPLLEAGIIERTIPDKPNSRLQKYRLTKKGEEYLKKQGKK